MIITEAPSPTFLTKDGRILPIHHAVVFNHVDTLILLLGLGVNPYKINAEGLNAFEAAVNLDRVDMIKVFLEHHVGIGQRVSHIPPQAIRGVPIVIGIHVDDMVGREIPAAINNLVELNHHIESLTEIDKLTLLEQLEIRAKQALPLLAEGQQRQDVIALLQFISFQRGDDIEIQQGIVRDIDAEMGVFTA